jgi:hypothetical protein
MAEAAVRSREAALVELGLRALAAESGIPDERDTLIVLAMLHNSSVRLGLDASTLFERISEFCETEDFGREMAGFSKRPSDSRDLSAFGLTEEDGPTGFRYVFHGFGGRQADR